jgi:capsular polysaccharide biosynthesis protein
MPPPIAHFMMDIWNRSIQPERPVKVYTFKNVFIGFEGLVFDENARLIDCTRTLHSEAEIDLAAEFVAAGRQREEIETIPKAILAKSRGAENYGHFIIEMLTRAWFARAHLDLKDWPALLHQSSPALQTVAIQALRQAGYQADRILIRDRTPVHVQELVFVDGLAHHAKYLSPYAMQGLDAIADDVPAADAGRIYVPRRPSPTRDFVAEDRIAAALSGLGFTEVLTATLSFREQIAAFKGAGTVVGPMGAALTNLAFCKPGTDVFLFMPSTALEALFWMIAEARRLNYLEIRCREAGPQTGPLPWDRGLDVDPRAMLDIIRAL